MILLENYELDYSLFVAEQELNESVLYYSSGLITESAGLMTIHEELKAVITDYLKKIGDGISKAWETFKEKFEILRNNINKNIKTITSKLPTLKDPKFTIENFPKINMQKLRNIKIPTFNIEEIKQNNITNVKEFMAKYFPMLDPSKSPKQAVEDYVIEGRSDERCTPELIEKMTNYITKDSTEDFQSISNDISFITTASKNINVNVNTVVSNIESFMFISEADDTRVKMVDDPDRKKDANSESSFLSMIKTFMSATCAIVSAKMTLVKMQMNTYTDTIKHTFNFKNQNEENKQEETNPQQ